MLPLIQTDSTLDFPGGSDGKASVYNVRDLGSIPGLGRFPGEGNGNPLQYSCLENPTDGGAWCRLLSMGSQRVGHDWTTSLSLSPSWVSSPASHSIPLGRHRAWGWTPRVIQQLSILRVKAHICQCSFFSLSHPLLPRLYPQVCSLCLCLLYCPANRFTNTLFLNPTCMH